MKASLIIKELAEKMFVYGIDFEVIVANQITENLGFPYDNVINETIVGITFSDYDNKPGRILTVKIPD